MSNRGGSSQNLFGDVNSRESRLTRPKKLNINTPSIEGSNESERKHQKVTFNARVDEQSRILKTTRPSQVNLSTTPSKTLEKGRHVSSSQLGLHGLVVQEEQQDIMRASAAAFNLAQRRQTQDQGNQMTKSTISLYRKQILSAQQTGQESSEDIHQINVSPER